VRSALDHFESHFSFYVPIFRSTTRSVEASAHQFLHGLLQSPLSNMEKMAETVVGSDYHRLHHMLSDSDWDSSLLRRQLCADANHSGLAGKRAGLLLDGSYFAKKGDASAGVQRQWNGRLGKVDNCQTGLFAVIARDGIGAFVDARLYLPKAWTVDSARCEKASIPEAARAYRTKWEMLLEIVRCARQNALKFGFVGFDGEFGQVPELLRALADDGEVFLAEVHCNQTIFVADPKPRVPERRSAKGRAPSRPVVGSEALTVQSWAATQPERAWRRVLIRRGEKGAVQAEFLAARVFVWDGKEAKARRWHLLVRRELDGSAIKYVLSNAPSGTSVHDLAKMQGERFFVERTFEDAKSTLGMAEYQVRKWNGWHHHMGLVMVATMFLAKERLALRETADLLSCADVVQMLKHRLPMKVIDDKTLAQQIIQRHERRQTSKDSAYRQQTRQIANQI
jgi:SRSO17 transposase